MAENEIALQPAAHPTDQFAAPEVRRKLPGAQLQQLAKALSGVSDTVGAIAQRYAPIYRENQIAGGSADVEKLGLSNMQAFHDAVQQGKINAADNPWYLVGVRQQLARNQAYGAANDIQQQYEQSGFKDKDDPQGYSQFLNQHLGQYLAGKDAYEVKAMQPILEQTRQDSLARYTNDRRVSREKTLTTATGTNWRLEMDRYSDDVNPDGTHATPEDMAKRLDQTTNNLQADLDRTSLTLGRNQAVDLMVQTAREAAIGKLDASFAITLLNRLKTKDGIPLAKLADTRAMLQQLPREVAELQARTLATKESIEQSKDQEDFRKVMSKAREIADKQFGGDLKKVTFSDEELWKMARPEAKTRWMQQQAAYAENQTNLKNARDTEALQPLREKLFGEAISGKLTPQGRNDMMMIAIKTGVMGQELVDRFEYFLRSAHYGTFIWGDTSPETKVMLNRQLDDGSLTPDQLLSLANEHKLNEHDFYQALDYVTFGKGGVGLGMPGGGGGMGSGRGGVDMQRLENLVAFGMTDPTQKTGLDWDKLKESRDFNIHYSQAQDELRQRWEELQKDPKFAASDIASKREAMNHAIDVISQAHGGVDFKTFSEYQRKYDPLEKLRNEGKPAATQPTTQPAAPPEPVIPGKAGEVISKSDPMLAQPVDTNTLRKLMLAPSNKFQRGGQDESFYGHYDSQSGFSKMFGTATWEADSLHQLLNWRGQYQSYTGNLQVGQRGSPIASLGNYANVKDAYQAHEINFGMAAMKRLQDLKPVAEVAQKELSQRLENFKAGDGTISTAEKARVAELSGYVYEYRMLRRQIGFTPDEVAKQKDGWQTMPMFVNDLDIRQRGPAVAQKLGIKDEAERVQFYKLQTKLTTLMRRQDDLQGPE